MIDIIMKTYLEYINSILPFKFIYSYDDGTTKILTFREQDIIHQTGLDSLTKYKIMKSKGVKGIATRALHDLKKGRISIVKISKDPNKAFIINKIFEYRFLTALLGDTKTEHYEFNQTLVPCNIPANYLLYDNQKNTHFHFGTIKDSEDYVFPMTWFIENNQPKKYIKNQKRMYINKISIEKK